MQLQSLFLEIYSNHEFPIPKQFTYEEILQNDNAKHRKDQSPSA